MAQRDGARSAGRGPSHHQSRGDPDADRLRLWRRSHLARFHRCLRCASPTVGSSGIRVQTDQLTDPQTQDQWGTGGEMNELVAKESFNDPDPGCFVAPPI